MRVFKSGGKLPTNKIKRKKIIFISILLVAVLLVGGAAVYLFLGRDAIFGSEKGANQDLDAGSGVFYGVSVSNITVNSAKVSARYWRGGDVANTSNKQVSDGKITTHDSRKIMRFATGLEKPATSLIKKLADINQDGKINSADARVALRMATDTNNAYKVNKTIYGDLNYDGTLNHKDKYIYYQQVRQGKSMDSAALKVADINGDGKVNATDYQILSFAHGYNFCVTTSTDSNNCQWKIDNQTFTDLKPNTTYYVFSKNHSVGGAITRLTSFKTKQSPDAKKTFTATFDMNGATSIGAASLSCSTSGNSCKITLPSIERKIYGDGFSFSLGWSTNPNDTYGTYRENTEIELTKNTTFYAISKFEAFIKFNVGNTQKLVSCAMMNRQTTCTVTVPSEFVASAVNGWTTSKNSSEIVFAAGSKTITVNKGMDLFPAEKNTTITATFDANGASNVSYTKRRCKISSGGCEIQFPTFNFKGKISNYWCTDRNCSSGVYYQAGSTTKITSDTTFYASSKSGYKGIDRDISIIKTFKVGEVIFEIQNGYEYYGPRSDQIKRINNSEGMGFLYNVPGKVFLLTDSTYKKLAPAGSGGVTYAGCGSYYIIDIPYYNYPEFKNALLHEMAHGWDYYYGFRKGKKISSQSEFAAFVKKYNSYWESYLRGNQVELFAASLTNYYWAYKSVDNKQKAHYGMISNISTAKRDEINKEFKTIIEKYINVSNNGYK